MIALFLLLAVSSVCAVYSGIYYQRLATGSNKEKLTAVALLIASFVLLAVSFDSILEQILSVWDITEPLRASSWLLAITFAALSLKFFNKQGGKLNKEASRQAKEVREEIINERAMYERHLNETRKEILILHVDIVNLKNEQSKQISTITAQDIRHIQNEKSIEQKLITLETRTTQEFAMLNQKIDQMEKKMKRILKIKRHRKRQRNAEEPLPPQ